MILHLGSDLVVYEKDIIMIIDASCAAAKNTRECIDAAGMVPHEFIGEEEEPKSYVIAKDGQGTKIYPSPISSGTLHKRIAKGLNIAPFGSLV